MLSIKSLGGDAAVCLTGRLDHQNAVGLLGSLKELAEVLHPLRLDLSEVGYVDVSGLSMLMTLNRHVRERGGEMLAIGASAAVRRATNLLGGLAL